LIIPPRKGIQTLKKVQMTDLQKADGFRGGDSPMGGKPQHPYFEPHGQQFLPN
jgi:hypothetical protein